MEIPAPWLVENGQHRRDPVRHRGGADGIQTPGRCRRIRAGKKGPDTMNESFRAALATAGLVFAGQIISDGRLHRFRAEGDREKNSWYLLHTGPPAAGAFGCWKRAGEAKGIF